MEDVEDIKGKKIEITVHSGSQPSLKSASCCVNTARLIEPTDCDTVLKVFLFEVFLFELPSKPLV
jgi:hypothetical protein